MLMGITFGIAGVMQSWKGLGNGLYGGEGLYATLDGRNIGSGSYLLCGGTDHGH